MARPIVLLKQYYGYCRDPEKVTAKQWFDLREKVRGAIEDLSFFAERLPPEQFEQVFTDKTLEPFIGALMKRDLPEGDSDVAKNSTQFKIGCMLLRWSLNITGALLNNFYAKELWRERELPMRKILELVQYDAKREAGEVGNTQEKSP